MESWYNSQTWNHFGVPRPTVAIAYGIAQLATDGVVESRHVVSFGALFCARVARTQCKHAKNAFGRDVYDYNFDC